MPYRIRPSSIIIKRIVFLSHFSLLPVCATELRSSFVKSFLEVNKADVLEDMNTFEYDWSEDAACVFGWVGLLAYLKLKK